MACTMKSMPSADAAPDLQKTACLIDADQHDEAVPFEHSDRVLTGMQHVVVADPVSACARQDRRIHGVNLS